MPFRETGSDDPTETYPHSEFLNDNSTAERDKRYRFITQRFVLPRIRMTWNERDDATPPTDAELESMGTMTLERVVDRALAKSVWVRAAITNKYDLRDSYRRDEERAVKDEDETERRSNKRSARRQERKIDYWTAEREAVDHALSAVIETRARVLSAVKLGHKR